VYPIAACGECYFCRQNRHSLCTTPYGLAHGADGGFAEFLLVPKQIVSLGGVVDIQDMPFDLAVMIEPVSCCLSAAETCGTRDGDKVLVIGCGPLGLLHVMVSKALGATVLASDTNLTRLEKAADLGADHLLDPNTVDVREEVVRLTGVGADVVIAAVGLTGVVEETLPLVRNRGVYNIFGGTPRGEMIKVDPRWLHYGELTVTGTFAASLPQFMTAHEFVRKHADAVSAVITNRCGLDGIIGAVEAVRAGSVLKSAVVFD
jgi:threonine dehydrogenase-like Zn-dependent dehydrogenase